MSSSRKRYALVGTGGRSVMYIDAVAKEFADQSQLVGFCDVSQTRMDWHNTRLKKKFEHPPVPTFPADQFERMVKETKPDVVIVTSMDSTHHDYIIRAMELGCDAISEKPMTVDAPKARAIFDAIDRTKRSLRVTFNYRYTAHVTKVREIIMKGTIGTPLAVDFSWVLDTSHGADYFRRWHREKDKSGGLLVHKATHHFDLVNWWIASYPKTVFAMGDLKFYGRKNAEARGEKYSYDRYTGVADAKNDPFALSLEGGKTNAENEFYMGELLQGLYKNAEKDSGYIRDRNVFGDNITIEDTMAVMVRYRSGVIMNYSLIAYSPWEGLRVAITGSKGRVEFFEKHGSHIIAGQDEDQLAATQSEGAAHQIKVFPMFGAPYEVPVELLSGGHGGGDTLLLQQLFDANAPKDPFHRAASHIDGAASILVGVSANESIKTGMPVSCDELLKLPENPYKVVEKTSKV